VRKKHWAWPINGAVRLGLFFLLVGGAFFYWGFVHRLWRINQVRNWTPSTCVITDSQVAVVHHKAVRGGTSKQSYDSWTYTIEVEYSFQANNQTYYGDTYSFDSYTFGTATFDEAAGSESLKYSIVASLPRGTKTTCFYDPADPNQSVLKRGVPIKLWTAIPSLIFVLLGLVFTIAGFAWQKRWA